MRERPLSTRCGYSLSLCLANLTLSRATDERCGGLTFRDMESLGPFAGVNMALHNRRQLARVFRPLLTIALTSFGLSPAHAATQWSSYQWPSAPQNIPLYQNVVLSATATDWTKYLSGPADTTNGGQGAAQDWSITSGPTSFLPRSETAVVDRRKCPSRTGEVEVCNNTYGQNGWLGIAQIWTSGNFIQKGSVKLNDSYFNLSTYSSDGWKYLVSCQEVGHTLGLSHDDTTFGDANFGTCMDYTNLPDSGGGYLYNGATQSSANNRLPNGNDYALLACMYATAATACTDTSLYLNSAASSGGGGTSGHGNHLTDGPTDFGIRVLGQPQPVDFLAVDGGNSPAEWGRPVAFTRDGRGRVFEREIAPGRKIVTEVFWAPR